MAKRELSEAERRRTMRVSVEECGVFNVTGRFGSDFVSPLAIALGASSSQIGFLASFPQLLYAAVQQGSPALMQWAGKRAKLMGFLALFQAFLWLPVLAVPFLGLAGNDAILLLTVVVAWINVFEGLIAPVWASVMGDVVPLSERGRYFARRNAVGDFVGLLALPVAGFILSRFSGADVFVGFAVLFFVAFASRLYGSRLLASYGEPPLQQERRPAVSRLFDGLSKTVFRRFLSWSFLLNFAVNVASPFFVVFALRDLHFDYFTYSLIVTANTLGYLLSWNYWGRLVDQYGSRKVLVACSIFTAAIPVLWLTNQKPAFLLFAEFFSGFAWAGINLASFDYALDASSSEERAQLVAQRNLAVGLGTFLGASLGGLMLAAHMGFLVFVGIPAVLAASAVLRLLAALYSTPRLRDVEPGHPHVPEHLFLVKALAGYPTRRGFGEGVGFFLHLTLAAQRAAVSGVRRGVRGVGKVGSRLRRGVL